MEDTPSTPPFNHEIQENPFQYIPGNQMSPSMRQSMELLREHYFGLLKAIGRVIPPGRCFSVIQTSLETACMWTMKGISHRNKGEC